MQKIYHLSTCDTCKRIIKELEPSNTFVFQDIKEQHINQNNWRHLENFQGATKRCLVNALDFTTREPLKSKPLVKKTIRV